MPAGCAVARNKGTCSNRLNIRVETLEASVVHGLRTHMMDPALFKEFCEEFTREMNRLRIERSSTLVAQRKELDRVQRDLDRAIQAILDGVPGAQLKDKIGALEARKAELTAILAGAKEPPPLELAIVLRGDLAAMLSFAADKKPGAVSGPGLMRLQCKHRWLRGEDLNL